MAGQRAGVLDLHPADLARRLLQGGVGRRQRPAQQVAPGCERADAKAVIAFVDGALARESRYVERSEEHTSELQSLMRISYAVFCLKKKTQHIKHKRL